MEANPSIGRISEMNMCGRFIRMTQIKVGDCDIRETDRVVLELRTHSIQMQLGFVSFLEDLCSGIVEISYSIGEVMGTRQVCS